MQAATPEAAPVPEGWPEAEMLAYMKKAGVAPIALQADARLAKERAAEWYAWCEREIIVPFGERMTGHSDLKEPVLKTVRNGIRLMRDMRDRDYTFTAARLAEECEKLVGAGMADPLIITLHVWAVHKSTRDFPRCQEMFDSLLVKRREEFKALPPSLRFLTATMFDALREDASQERKNSYDKTMIKAALEAIAAGCYVPEVDDEVLTENLDPLFDEEVMKGDEKQVWGICESPKISEWSRNILKGLWHNRMAWMARGTGWANQVKPEGWLGYEEHSKLARGFFYHAWELNPKRPKGASGMTLISNVGAGEAGDDPRMWFDRAVAAEFDYMQPYHALRNGLRPRWGGSVQESLAFGLAAAQTRRFDTEVPYGFLSSLKVMAGDAEDYKEVCHDPLMAKVAVALCRQQVKDAPTEELRQEALAILGGMAWACGDYVAAADAFARLPGRFPRSAVRYLNFFTTSEEVMRGESEIFVKGLEGQWLAAEKYLLEKAYVAAAGLYEGIALAVDGAGKDLASSRLAKANFENSFDKKDWVSLDMKPGLKEWTIRKGNWEAHPKGGMVLHGVGDSAYILFNGRIGTEFQMRGEYEFVNAKDRYGLLIMLGWADYKEGEGKRLERETWISYADSRDKVDQAGIWDIVYRSSVMSKAIGGMTNRTKFLITCHNGLLTYVINGREIYRNVQAYEGVPPFDSLNLSPDGLVGFGNPQFRKGMDTCILNVEVRKLDETWSPEQETKAQTQAGNVEAKDIRSTDDLLAYLDESEWEVRDKPDGQSVATISMNSRYRTLSYYKAFMDNQEYAMDSLDSRTLVVDKEKKLTFNEDYTRFEITGLREMGAVIHGVLTFRPGIPMKTVMAPLTEAESVFAGSRWKRFKDSLIFHADGTWEETGANKRRGTWKVQSATEAACFDDKKIIRQVEMSKDGKSLWNEVRTTWKRAE